MNDSKDVKKSPYEFIYQVEQDGAQIPASEQKRRTKWEKLGAYNLWVLIIGTVLILLSIAFLAFVWIVAMKQSRTSHLPRLWVDIVHRDWTSRVVTMATILVRAALTAQLCVFAAIMAALILEQVGASNEDFPMLSMIRCANTGPQALIWNVIHTVTTGSQWRYSLIIVATILNALALQFMSTLLLADFGNDLVVLDDHREVIHWGIDESREETSTAGSDFWRSSQSSYPTFAEYKQNASHGANFVDSGTTYRGFLPFINSTIRENVLSYSGPMTVVDERVVCVKPTLTNAEYHIPAEADDTLSATFDFVNIHPDVIQHGTTSTFNCTMAHYWHNPDAGYWYTSICRLNLGSGELRGGILPGDERQHETNVWLIFNITSPWADGEWLETVKNPNETVVVPLRQMNSPDGPWAKIGHTNLTADVSLCLLNPKPDVYEVKAVGSRSTFTKDNTLYWDSSARKYITFRARTQLDAIGPLEFAQLGLSPTHSYSHEDRGVLSLQPVADWNATRAANKYNAKYQTMIHGSLDKNKPWNYAGAINDSFVLTPKSDFADAIHRNHMWVAQDILSATRNPALALQAVTHLVMQGAYYDWFANYDLGSAASYSMTETRYIPVMWHHFGVVGALLVLHFMLVAVALALFVTKTEVSLLGNAWQAVAQVCLSDTEAAVRHGAVKTDAEVREEVRSGGMGGARHVIRKGGRLEAVVVRKGRE